MLAVASIQRVAIACVGLAGAVFVQAQTAPAASPAPLAAPALKDADGRTLRLAPTGHLTNNDEDKVPPCTLPDPLVLADGRPVRAADTWFLHAARSSSSFTKPRS